jgi:hypothetical protein
VSELLHFVRVIRDQHDHGDRQHDNESEGEMSNWWHRAHDGREPRGSPVSSLDPLRSYRLGL